MVEGAFMEKVCSTSEDGLPGDTPTGHGGLMRPTASAWMLGTSGTL